MMTYCYLNGRSADHQMPVCLSEKNTYLYDKSIFCELSFTPRSRQKLVYFSVYVYYTVTRGQPFLLLTNRKVI